MSADLLRQLLALDLSTEQALAVMDIIENRDGDRKEKARARWHKWNDKRLPNVSKREQTLANVSKPTHASASPAPDLENKQTNKQGRKQDSAPMARVGLEGFRSELSSILDHERIEAIEAVRRKKGAVLSAHAGRLLVKALSACPDINAAADEMVLRNWTGIKPDWLESRSRQNGHSPPNGKRMNAVEAMLSLQAERENEQSSRTIDNGNVELLPPDKPGLPRPVVDLSQAFRWPGGQRDH